MRKITIMISIVIILQIIFPIFRIMDNNLFTSISKAETNYTNINLDTLEEIKDNPEALAQVTNITVLSKNKRIDLEINKKILGQLEYIKLCSNLQEINISMRGLNIDKNFFNIINSKNNVRIILHFVNVDFSDVSNSSITKIYLFGCRISNFACIDNLSSLKSIIIESSDTKRIRNRKFKLLRKFR